MRVGARIFKTAIAIIISYYLSEIFGLHPSFYAGLAAFVAIQPTIFRSWQHFLEQTQANLVGAILAIGFGWFFGTSPFIIAIVTMLVITLNLQFKFEKSIELSVFTVFAIMQTTEDHFLLFALNRFTLIMLGVLIAIIVNAFFWPPKYSNRFLNDSKNLANNINNYLKLYLNPARNNQELKKDIKVLKNDVDNLKSLFIYEKEEQQALLSKKSFKKQRSLVIHRNLVNLFEFAYVLINTLEKYRSKILLNESEDLLAISNLLNEIVDYHQQLYLELDGKLLSNELEKLTKQEALNNLAKNNNILFTNDYSYNTVIALLHEYISLIIKLQNNIHNFAIHQKNK